MYALIGFKHYKIKKILDMLQENQGLFVEM